MTLLSQHKIGGFRKSDLSLKSYDNFPIDTQMTFFPNLKSNHKPTNSIARVCGVRVARYQNQTRAYGPVRDGRSVPRAPQRANKPPQTGPYRAEARIEGYFSSQVCGCQRQQCTSVPARSSRSDRVVFGQQKKFI
ncbi:unnamed protein product [Spodoptera exigua]|nr:unnamed protein product [Spodoptera exigua]